MARTAKPGCKAKLRIVVRTTLRTIEAECRSQGCAFTASRQVWDAKTLQQAQTIHDDLGTKAATKQRS